MIRRAAVSRADLVRCLGHRAADLDACAERVGFVRRECPKPDESFHVVVPDVTPSLDETIAQAKEKTKRVTFWQHTRTEPHFVDMDKWLATNETAPRTIAELIASVNVRPAKHKAVAPPLIPWNKLWPFARAALGTTAPTSRVDVRALVRALSRGETVRRIPCRTKQTWAPQAKVILDRDRRLVPYWDDQIRFLERLRRWRGKLGLDVAYPRSADEAAAHMEQTPPHVPILVLSDLGCLESHGDPSRDWLATGRMLAAKGHRPVALVPCPRHLWSSPLDRVWRMACWDRGQPLPALKPDNPRGVRRLPAADRQRRDGGLRRLLACLSMLVNVEPPLLRALRLMLSEFGCDVAAEYEVWRHADVDGDALTAMGMKKDESVRDAHRRVFANDVPPAIQRRAFDLVHAQHDGKKHREFFLEEVSHFAALGIAPADLSDVAREFYRNAALFLRAEPADETKMTERFGAAAWVHRAVARLPASVRRWEEISECWRLAERILRQGLPRPASELPRGTSAWSATPKAKQSFDGTWWQVWQRGEDLSLEPVDASESSSRDVQQLGLQTRVKESSAPGTPPREFLRTGAPLANIRSRSGSFELLLTSRDEVGRAGRTTKFFVETTPTWRPHCAIGNSVYIIVKSDRQRIDLTPKVRLNWSTLGRDRHGLYGEITLGSVTHRMRWIGPGTFMMGSPEDEPERSSDETLHQVTLTRGFWLGATACTQSMWEAVMGDNPSYFKQKDGENRPVEQVSWEDCAAFLARANEFLPDGGFRLPTEAEWEYACRAGTTTPYSFGDSITPELVNYWAEGEKRRETVGVKALPCNAWGLYQMHGNVWEWCSDWRGDYSGEPVDDPQGPRKGVDRVVRGGSWNAEPRRCRSAYRRALRPGYRYRHLGFRLARGQ
jgi:formylglycine-generating enzyme required for sulfatase activity